MQFYSFRVLILNSISDFLLLLGKLVVVGTVGLLSFYVFSGELTLTFRAKSIGKQTVF